MKPIKIAKAALATGAVILALTVAPAAVASASPAVFVPCSGGGPALAAAIAAANVTGGTINLAPGCTYSLTSGNYGGGMAGFNGLPVVTNAITIDGFFSTIAANNTTFRIIQVNGPGGNLTLQGVILTGGNAVFGGAILNVEGAVTLNHSRVTGNTGQMGGGGIASGVVDPSHLGPIGTLTLNSSQVIGNTANGGGGGGIVNHAGTLTMNFSQVNGNISAGGGGGIASGNGMGGAPGTGSSTLNLFFSQVNGNTSNGGPTAGAGGIANGGVATINLSQVNGNSAPGSDGGGILNHGTMTVNFSQIKYNSVPGGQGAGGGIANISFGFPGSGVLTVNLSQVNNNSAPGGGGGGIANINAGLPESTGMLTINASQVNNNVASGGLGGGIFEAGIDPVTGLPTAVGDPLALNFSQVINNSALPGGDGGGIYTIPGSPVLLKLSLVVANTPDNCVPLGSVAGCVG